MSEHDSNSGRFLKNDLLFRLVDGHKEKFCAGCGVYKRLNEFGANRALPEYVTSRCLKCAADDRLNKKLAKGWTPPPVVGPDERFCKKHGVQPIENFLSSRGTYSCKTCRTLARDAKSARDGKKRYIRPDYTLEKRFCYRCSFWKPFSHFNKSTNCKAGISSNCSLCEASVQRDLRERTPQEMLEAYAMVGRKQKQKLVDDVDPKYVKYLLQQSFSAKISGGIKVEEITSDVSTLVKGVRLHRAINKTKRRFVTVDKKFCKKCEKTKPSSYFGIHSSSADGLRGSCKACENSKATPLALKRKKEKRNANPIPASQ